MLVFAGYLQGLQTRFDTPIAYGLQTEGETIALNHLIGQQISLEYDQRLQCDHCQRSAPKLFQGYCYRCTQRLARCDLCMVRPERCHFAQGTCREPDWGREHCLRHHVVYLANASQVKVGITRQDPPHGRWIDQGAEQGLVILSTSNRLQAGQAEVILKQYIADKTNWRRMLSGPATQVDLIAVRDRLLGQVGNELEKIPDVVPSLSDVVHLEYPVLAWPSVIKSLNLQKESRVQGRLQGIKGQYLILDTGVINMRAQVGAHLSLRLL